MREGGASAAWFRLAPPRAGGGEQAARMRFRRAVVVCSPLGALRYAAPPRPASPMAKRRAEPLVCYAPFKRLVREPSPPPRAALPERRPRNEAAGAGPAAKRKLEEAEAPPGKRPGLRGGSPRGEQSDAAGRRRRRGEPTAPQEGRTAEGRDGRRGEEPAAAPQDQYNSFLYWRAPLPTIDLSDIQSLHGDTTSADKTPSRTDTMETEMET